MTIPIFLSVLSLLAGSPESAEREIRDALAGHVAAIVLIDCTSGKTTAFPNDKAGTRLAPCSTFKIFNTLIGLETGILNSPGQPFYKWDGVKRTVPAWNRDLTLEEAFRASCVPAFQALARRIGAESMQKWMKQIHYGDGDISGGIDVFWLPATGRKTILISPREQAELMHLLVTGRLPFHRKAIAALRKMMLLKTTDAGTLYGKTGSGTDDAGNFNLGWFVGFVESAGRTTTFACVVQGENVMSKQARELVESILLKHQLL